MLSAVLDGINCILWLLFCVLRWVSLQLQLAELVSQVEVDFVSQAEVDLVSQAEWRDQPEIEAEMVDQLVVVAVADILKNTKVFWNCLNSEEELPVYPDRGIIWAENTVSQW